MSQHRATIVDVAAKAGVSKSLVSLALRDRERVSSASYELIIAAIADLDYRPNAAARSLVDQRTNTIGIVVLDLHNPIFAQVLDGLLPVLRQRKMNSTIVTGNAVTEIEISEVSKLQELRVEGLVLLAHRMPASFIHQVAQGIPMVIVTRTDIRGNGISTVSNDDVYGAKLAVRHLIDLGHKRISHITGGANQISLNRLRGYEEEMSSHGLAEFIQTAEANFTDRGGFLAAQSLLETDSIHAERPTAIFVANDLSAFGAMAAVVEAGYRIPQDISIIGYDGISLGALKTISLTTVSQPLTAMGEIAAHALIELIKAPAHKPQHIRVEPELVVRGTTGRAPLIR